MFGKIISNRYSCGLDIGAHSIKTAILEKTNKHSVELLGVYENQTYGFRDSSITNLAELSDCISNAVNNLNKKFNIKIKDISLGINSQLIISRSTDTAIPLIDRGNKVITNRDIKKVNRNARLLSIKMEEEILHSVANKYKVDDVNIAENPKGLYGHKLQVSALMIMSNANSIRNIYKAVHQAGYDVSRLSFDSYAASNNIFTDKDFSEGCILVDIGANNTVVLMFTDNVLQFIHKIPLGGDYFSKSIADKLGLSFDLAEEIKKSYAVASLSDLYRKEEILVKKDSEYIPIKKDLISEAIESILCELENEIKNSIEKSGLNDKVKNGITAVGGGSLLSGLIERISRKTNLSTKIGRNIINSKLKDINSPLFASAIGLAQQGFPDVINRNNKIYNKSVFNSLTNRIRDLYQEYF